jgi:hypothetical protein
VILLVGWLGMLMVSAWTTHLQVCSDEVARVGSTALARSCGSLSLTDAPSLAVLVVVGILLFPELSSLEIPGILRVERKLEAQARRQEDIAGLIQRLEVSMGQRVEVRVVNEVGSLTARASLLATQQDEKREQFESTS